MKNLKKVLSLALALVMAMSLMTTAFAADASDFADYDKVTNTEAMDVMVAVGVFEGADGKLDPTGTLTREQAAKIVTYMLLGKDEADKLSTTNAPYADVAADRWSAGAIAYCTSEGILAGSNGKFNPTDKLTGQQFAKMLLCALGYNAEQEGLVGGSWAIKASTLATKLGLDKNVDVLLSANLTREQAAQMALNSLKADCVEYVGGTNITIGDTTIMQGATRQPMYVTPGTAGANSIGTGENYNIPAVSANARILQLGEKLYKGDLALATGAHDSFGRPGVTWTYDSNPVGTYAADADYTATVTSDTAMAKQAVGTTLNAGLNKILGITATNKKVDYDGGTVMQVNNVTKIADTDNQFEAGDVVEIYLDTDALTIDRVIVTRQSYGKILAVTENTGKAKAAKTDANGDKIVYNYKITIDTNGDTTADITTNDIDLVGYTADYVKGAYLNLTLKNNTVLDSSVAKTETGAITAFTADANATMAGSKYTFANASIVGHGTSVDFKTGDYTLVLNDAGYVTAVITNAAAAATLSDVVYSDGVLWTETSTKYGVTTTTVYTQVVSVDGIVSDIEIGAYKAETARNQADTANYTKYTELYDETDVIAVTTDSEANDTVAVSNKSANLYTIADVAATSTVPAHKKLVSFSVSGYTLDSTTLANNGQIKTSDTKLLTTGKYIGSDTLFTQITGSGTTTKAATYTGSMGYKNTSGSAQNVYYIYKASTGALSNVVVLTNSLTTTTADVLYISATTSAQNGASTYLQENVYDRDGNKLDPITVIADDKNVTGFVTYSVTDGKYDLTACADSFVGDDTDWSTGLGVKYYEGVTFVKDFYDNYASFKKDSKLLLDIPAADLTVVDLRSSSDKSNGYDADVTSLGDVLTAYNTLADETYYYDVAGAVYLSADGAATFFVTGITKGSATSR